MGKARRRRRNARRTGPQTVPAPATPACVAVIEPPPLVTPALAQTPEIPWIPAKPALAIAVFCAIITAPRFLPIFDNWHIFEWDTVGLLLDFHPRAGASSPLEDAQRELRPEDAAKSFLSVRIEDPADNLAPFWESLRHTERGEPGAVTRILHYGDSPTTADMITADVRNLLQQQFGNAGHGTYLIAKPWAWYAHDGVDSSADGWTIDPANMGELRDGRFGLGGVSFRGDEGAASRLRLRDEGHTRITVSYLASPGAGAFSLSAGNQTLGSVDTDAPEVLAGQQSFPLRADARDIRLKVVRGTVRLFGYTLFTDAPGVLYDSLGLNGAYTRVLAHVFDEAHWAEQLRQAHPQLVIVNYGTNESVYDKYVDYAYEKELRETIRRIRTAVPEASILLMSPMDRGERKADGNIGTVPVLPRLITLQEKLARSEKIAFFNTYEAMGGSGTMGKWYGAEPRLVSADFIHPLPSGARIVGTLFYRALLEGFNRHKLKSIRTNLAQTSSLRGGKP